MQYASDAQLNTLDLPAKRSILTHAASRNERTYALLKEESSLLDPAHPIFWPEWKKWLVTFVYCTAEVFVTITSTSYISAEGLAMDKFSISAQVAALGQSMFLVGTAAGPLFLGPMADIAGRKWVYVASIALYAVFNIGTALAYNFPMLVIFQFLAGAAGSTALTNVAGTIADMWADRDEAGQPMALFVLAANIGPSLGSVSSLDLTEISLKRPYQAHWRTHVFLAPASGGFSDELRYSVENAKLGLPWLFWINVIIGGALAVFLCFMPETLPLIVISRMRRNRDLGEKSDRRSSLSIAREMYFVATMAFRIMLTEPIVTSLGVYNGFCYGLLFLYLEGVFDVFVINNGLSYLGASLTYLNFIVGVFVMFCLMPIQTHLYKRDRERRGQSRPEARLLTSLVVVWLFPASLFWAGFTSEGNVNYWSPLVAGATLAFSEALVYLAMLNYIVDSYPSVAASAVAAFLVPSFTIAAAFVHIGVLLFQRLSTKWAFATLGFISLGVCGLVYLLYFSGPFLRRKSRFALSQPVTVSKLWSTGLS